MSIYAIFIIISTIVCFVIAMFIYIQDKDKQLNQSYALFSCLLGVYTFMLFGSHLSNGANESEIWLRAIGIWGFVFASAIYFILVLTEQNKILNSRLFQGIIILSCLAILVLDAGFPELTNNLLVSEEGELLVTTKLSTPMILEILWLGGALLFCSIISIRYYRKLDDVKRKRLVFFSLLGIIIPGLYLLIVLSSTAIFSSVRNEGVAILFNVLVTSYAISKYNVFNLSSEVASRDIIKNMSNFMILINPERAIVETNPATLQLLDYSSDEIIKKYICHCFEEKSCLLLIDECSRFNNVADKETYLITKNGARIPVLISIAKIVRKGQHVGFVLVGNNLTEQKEAKKQLNEYNKRLEESNRELGQFVHVVSHDLKEPMRMVANYVSLLNSRYNHQLDATAQEFMKYSVDGTKQMKELIDGLLEYSKVDRNYKPTDVNLESVMLVVSNTLRYSIKNHNALVETSILPVIQGNKSQLKQLFQNLISNGIKYHADDRPPIVKIDVEERENEWLFSIQDNGIGIDEESKERVFGMFQRLHKRTNKYKGTGIGLAICKKIVEKHNGRIWIESELGVGSTFYFTIAKNLN